MFGDKRRNRTVTTHRRRRRTTRPANVIAAVVGILAVVIGVWALVKTGINTDHIFTPPKKVLGLPHTPTLAIGEIVFGLVLLFAAAAGAFGTFLIAVLGAASLAFGVVVLSDSWSGRVHSWTAANHDTGWIFVVIGAVFLLAAVLPLFVSERVTEREAPVAPEPEPVAAEPEESAVPASTAGEDGQDTEASPAGSVDAKNEPG